MRSDLKRTTVRLPRELHDKLREATGRLGMTAEQIIQRALARELSDPGTRLVKDSAVEELYETIRKGLGDFRERFNKALEPAAPLDEVDNWSSMVAYRLLQNLPTIAVIKNSKAQIVWCNALYEKTFGHSLQLMRGKTITELGHVPQKEQKHLEDDIQGVFESDTSNECLETVYTAEGAELLLRVHRFVFTAHGERYLGDISYAYYKFEPKAWGASEPPQFTTVPPSATLALLIPFLENCPAEVSVKDRDGRYVWGNPVLLQRAKVVSIREIAGKTAEEIWGLELSHPFIENEAAVFNKKIWLYVEETLPGRPSRTSLYFPVFADERVQQIGVVCAAFKLKAPEVQPQSVPADIVPRATELPADSQVQNPD